MTNARVLVFLGPSMCVEDAREILPDALFLPPVQCGDIVRVLRLRPRVIAIIDGIFERVPAVWHKEILLAIRSGVAVVGGGSMGALRAAELGALGMIGVGRSAKEYLDGTLTDDDEVALVHTADGEALSDAMVNIRDTAEAAEHAGLLSRTEAAAVVDHAKEQFYAERTFDGSVRAVISEGRSEAVLAWSRAGGFCDRKRDDARQVLELAGRLARDGSHGVANEPQLVTGFLRTLARQASCSSQRRMSSELPHEEQVACAARFLGRAYEDLRRLGLLMAAVHDIATHQDAPTDAGRARATSVPQDVQARWRTLEQFVERMAVSDEDVRSSLLDLMRLEGIYPHHRRATPDPIAGFAERAPRHHRHLGLIAGLWCAFDRRCAAEALVPRTADLQEFADRFRYVRGLNDDVSMRRWLADNDLTEARFIELMISWYRFEHLVPTANLGVFGIAPHADGIWWLRDALYVSGAFAEAEALLRSPSTQRCTAPVEEADAFARDFSDGLVSVQVELRAMRDGLMVAV